MHRMGSGGRPATVATGDAMTDRQQRQARFRDWFRARHTPNAMSARVGMHSKVHDMRIAAKSCDNTTDDMPIQFRNPDILLRHIVGDTLCHGRQAKMHVGCIGCNQTSRQRIHIF